MDEFGIDAIVQIAYMVDDIETSAQTFSELTGAGPFLVRRNRITSAVGPGGEPGEFDHTSAYGQWGRLQVELVEAHSVGPAQFAETTRERGRIHHVAMFVGSCARRSRQYTERGHPALLSATTSSGNAVVFHDTRGVTGHLLELYEPRESIIALYRRVAAVADGWDGRDPVRPM